MHFVFFLLLCYFWYVENSGRMRHSEDDKSVGGFSNVEDEPMRHKVARAIHLPPIVGNVLFHVMHRMLHLVQIKGLLGGLASENANLHPWNFVEIFQPFKINNISQELIRLRLFCFSLTEEATPWLEEFPKGLSLYGMS